MVMTYSPRRISRQGGRKSNKNNNSQKKMKKDSQNTLDLLRLRQLIRGGTNSIGIFSFGGGKPKSSGRKKQSKTWFCQNLFSFLLH